jgi:hypothetical protein
MSLLSIATTFQLAAFAISARCLDPYNPCSSPVTATKIKVKGNSFYSLFYNSIIAATPEASSLAPGASDLASITSVTRESRWPLIISTRSSVGSVPLMLPLRFLVHCLAIRLPSALIVK